MNLHALARGAITSIHPEEMVQLYQSLGNINKMGRVVPQFTPAFSLMAQIQSEGGDTLEQNRDVNFTSQIRRCYLFSDQSPDIPQGIVRWYGRGGDIIERGDGTFWKVVAILEDFSDVGWVSLRIQELVEIPEMDIIEPEEPEEPEPENPDPEDPDNPDDKDPDNEDGGDDDNNENDEDENNEQDPGD